MDLSLCLYVYSDKIKATGGCVQCSTKIYMLYSIIMGQPNSLTQRSVSFFTLSMQKRGRHIFTSYSKWYAISACIRCTALSLEKETSFTSVSNKPTPMIFYPRKTILSYRNHIDFQRMCYCKHLKRSSQGKIISILDPPFISPGTRNLYLVF